VYMKASTDILSLTNHATERESSDFATSKRLSSRLD
jgi:hypothetical protein